jgi:hypothetical protein
VRLLYGTLALLVAISPASSQTQFNPYTRRFEIAPPNATPQFNPYSGQYEMAPPGLQPTIQSS